MLKPAAISFKASPEINTWSLQTNRVLFPVDKVSVSQFNHQVVQELNQLQKKKSQKYDFDFEADRPIKAFSLH